MFLSKFGCSPRAVSGYKPSLYWDDIAGCRREPNSAEELRAAADQENAEILGGDTKRAPVRFLRDYYDEVGNWTAEVVAAEGLNENEKAVRDAFL